MQAQCPSVELVAKALYQPPMRFRRVVLRCRLVSFAVVLGSASEVWRVCVGCFQRVLNRQPYNPSVQGTRRKRRSPDLWR